IPPHPIIPNQTKLPIKEPKHSFKIGYEHLNTNLVTKDVAESSNKNLIPIPHECKVASENGNYINRMEMLFTINPCPHNLTNVNTNVKSFSSLPIPIQEIDPRQEEIDVISVTNDVLPLKPPDKEFDFEINFENEISVVRNVIVKFECIDAKVKFDVFNDKNDVSSYFMFVIFAKEFSLLFAESEDTIFDPGISE
nr:hypothetical protein [Tanacetum cinerariifolium]